MKQSLRRLTAGGLALCFALSLTTLPALADDAAAPDASVTTAEATPVSGDNTEVLPPEDPGSKPEQPTEEPSEEPDTPQTIATTWTSAHVRYLGGYEDRSVRPERQVTRRGSSGDRLPSARRSGSWHRLLLLRRCQRQ